MEHAFKPWLGGLLLVSGAALKCTLRWNMPLSQTAFNMWMGCYSQQEIADEVGYGKQAVSEFLDFLQSSAFGMGAENGQSSEKPELANSEDREFDEDEEDSNSLGVYKLDKLFFPRKSSILLYRPGEIAGTAEAVDVLSRTVFDWASVP